MDQMGVPSPSNTKQCANHGLPEQVPPSRQVAPTPSAALTFKEVTALISACSPAPGEPPR